MICDCLCIMHRFLDCHENLYRCGFAYLFFDHSYGCESLRTLDIASQITLVHLLIMQRRHFMADWLQGA